MLKKILAILTLLILITACDATKNNIFAPNRKLLKQLPKKAELYPDYKAGWLDGCETGMATGFGNDYYKTFYKFKKDRRMVEQNNVVYLRAWSHAMIACRHSVLGTLKEAGMTPRLPGEGCALRLKDHSILGSSDSPGVFSPKNWGAQGLSKW